MNKKNSTLGTDEMRTYLVTGRDGTVQKITVPSSWKVTFGPLNPGNKNGGPCGDPCLRFYEAENQQRAVIANVAQFRDLSIKVEEKRVNTKRQTLYRNENGGEKAVVVEGRVEEWIDPDVPQEEANTEFFRQIEDKS